MTALDPFSVTQLSVRNGSSCPKPDPHGGVQHRLSLRREQSSPRIQVICRNRLFGLPLRVAALGQPVANNGSSGILKTSAARLRRPVSAVIGTFMQPLWRAAAIRLESLYARSHVVPIIDVR